jgi:hypothetical protein
MFVQSIPNAAGPITGPATNLCLKDNQTYSIAAVTGATSYTWTVPTGVTIKTNNGTNIIVKYTSSFVGTGNITVKANNSCGSSAVSTLAITSALAQPGTISGKTAVCKSNTAIVYSITPVAGATSYTWSITGGPTFVGTTTGTSVTVKFTTATSNKATISVRANNACTGSVAATLAIDINLSCRTSEDPIEVTESSISIFPNPSEGSSTVRFVSNVNDHATIEVYNSTGSLVSTLFNGDVKEGEPHNLHFECPSCSYGIYYVRMVIGNEIKYEKMSIVK